MENINSDHESDDDTKSENRVDLSLSSMPPECLQAIAIFCDANTLCCLDLVSRSFQNHTDYAFDKLAYQKFGLTSSNNKEKTGKTIWRKGLALVQPKHHLLVPLSQPAEYVCEPNRDELHFSTISTHPTSAMVLCEPDNFCGGHFTLLTGENALYYRDSQTLNFVRCFPNPWIVESLAACGQEGCEVIVTAHKHQILARRGRQSQTVCLRDYDHGQVKFQIKDPGTASCGVELVGDEEYLVAIYWDILYVFQPTMHNGGELLSFVTSIKFPCATDLDFGCYLRRACAELPGVFGFLPSKKEVSIWQIQIKKKDALDMEPTQLVSFKTSTEWAEFALGERYVAGSTDFDYDKNDKSIYVHCKQSGRELHILNEPDVAELEEAGEIFYSVLLEFVGDLLVTTSWFKDMVCVWGARSGTLLRRYNGESECPKIATPPVRDPSPLNRHMTTTRTMARLHQEGSVSFLTAGHHELRLWSFPYNFRGNTMAKTLQKREKRLQKLRNAFDFNQDPIAFV